MEGSTWEAYKVTDELFLGDEDPQIIQTAKEIAIPFSFGCQTMEKGLFRSQLADGIMGMSAAADTIPSQLKAKGVATTSTFALCLSQGGGILTLGGVDTRMHTSRKTSYAALTASATGAYNVQLLGVYLNDISTGGVGRQYVNVSNTVYNTGKGTIVDSGTTDTYLPVAAAAAFKAVFRKVTKKNYQDKQDVVLTQKEVEALPEIIFQLAGAGKSEPVEVAIPPTSYVEQTDDGKFTFRVFLTEKSGAVLGSNFMENKNVIFDLEQKKLGLAAADCSYTNVMGPITKAPVPGSDVPVACIDELVPYTDCSATCDKNEAAYVATGYQDWVNECHMENKVTIELLL